MRQASSRAPSRKKGTITLERPLSCVLLADRHHELTERIRGLLETAFETVVMVADEKSLIDGAGRLQPEVAVVDLSLSRESSLDWLRALRSRSPDLKVIVVSIHDEQAVRNAVTEAGADAFVLKHAIATDLLPAIDRVRGAHSPVTLTDGEGEDETS